jgi:hypothetical protein
VPFICGLGGISAALAEGSNASVVQAQSRAEKPGENATAAGPTAPGNGSNDSSADAPNKAEASLENTPASGEPKALDAKEDLYGGVIINPASLPVR